MDYLLLTANNRHIRDHGHIVARPFGWVKGVGRAPPPPPERVTPLAAPSQSSSAGSAGVCGRPSPRSHS
ncbi:MAG: hypothetical protein IPL28_01995 [Chloroflexi bacterium]|nr:hypothetical protein [Chloroflexota bacterium]